MLPEKEEKVVECQNQIIKEFDDGYLIRKATKEEIQLIKEWRKEWTKDPVINDLDIIQSCFDDDKFGIYIGELDGKPVASAVVIPWGKNIYYVTYFFVLPVYACRGYDERLRETLFMEEDTDKIIVMDGDCDLRSENEQLGYEVEWKTLGYLGIGENIPIESNCLIKKAKDIDFQKIVEYDNKIFVSKNYLPRKTFLRGLIEWEHGTSYVALSDDEKDVIGFACQRDCVKENRVFIGPLYASSSDIAHALLASLMQDIIGKEYITFFWSDNTNAKEMFYDLEGNCEFDFFRMHKNGNPGEFNDSIYCFTSSDVCGF